MRERPILFSTEMVKAILESRKTQTRRVIKNYTYEDNLNSDVRCPYGQVGDRLWVRETFVLESDEEYQDESFYYLVTDRPIKTIPEEGEYGSYHLIPHYRATEPEPNIVTDKQDDEFTRWRPSIFMPRWASRITLEITDIRVQRVQEISQSDAIAEGLIFMGGMADNWDEAPWCASLKDQEPMKYPSAAYGRLWDSINAKRGYGWDKNPWVWAISFKVLKNE